MSKRPVISTFLTIVALVMLLNFKTPDMTTITGNSGSNTGSPNIAAVSTVNPSITVNVGAGRSNSSSTAGTPSPTTASAAGASSGQFAGSVVQTPYGAVQVQVTIAAGKIADVATLQLPGGNRHSTSIASYAAPQLRSEVLSAQSAQVNTISGATYTSQGYLQSLQSALDQAKFV